MKLPAFLLILIFFTVFPSQKIAAIELEYDVKNALNVKAITPILFAHDVQSCVTFWSDLGLEVKLVVPAHDEEGIAFAILSSGDSELMYRSFASAAAQDATAIEGVAASVIYIDLDSLKPVLDRRHDLTVAVDTHETAYGMFEIYVRDPAGHLIGFAAPVLD